MKISIITASYNYAQYICETIESVLNQTYQDWELIVVDDGSSDNSVEIIKEYCKKDSRIKLFQHKADCEQRLKDKTTLLSETPFNASDQASKNKGLKETILLGLKNATGDWIAFLESDDVFEPDNLLKRVEIAQKFPNVKLIFNKPEFVQEGAKNKFQSRIFEKNLKQLSKMHFPKNMFKDLFYDNLLFTFSDVMVKADVLKNTDFNTPFDTNLDWWLWVHIAEKNDFYYIDEELTKWRLHQNSYIKKSNKPIFCFTQINAYEDVCKKKSNPIELRLFILQSKFKYIFIKTYRFFLKLISRNIL